VIATQGSGFRDADGQKLPVARKKK
jgi:hypothetical protein